LDALVPTLCALGHEQGDPKKQLPIRAAALQALADMVLRLQHNPTCFTTSLFYFLVWSFQHTYDGLGMAFSFIYCFACSV
jgi:hypothetical protein